MGAVACGTRDADRGFDVPAEVDLGELYRGDPPPTFEVALRNGTAGLIVVERLIVPCSCVSATKVPITVPAGGVGVLPVRFHHENAGSRVSMLVELECDEAGARRRHAIRVHAHVLPSLEVTPALAVVDRRQENGPPAPVLFDVRSTRGRVLRFLGGTVLPAGVKIEPRRLSDSAWRFELTVARDGGGAPGDLELPLRFDEAGSPRLASARVRIIDRADRLLVPGGKVSLGYTRDRALDRTIPIPCPGCPPAAGLRARFDDPSATAEVMEAGAGMVALRVHVEAPRDGGRAFHGILTISTADAGDPGQRVAVSAYFGR